MKFNYAALAIPAFFIFLGLEYLAANRSGKQHYFKFDSSVSSLTIGIAERLMTLFISLSFYQAFEFVYRHYALFNIPSTWFFWILLILATDLVWYWYHRFSHEVNVLWSAHVVHHQSEEFNYTVSARITVFQSFIRNGFWCVLPLIGFQPIMVVTMLVIHGTYSFFTHTRFINKLGWLEHVLITPSHHRVHHASNEKYLNKNYGDIFIFWDKLFGTFQQEEETPVYGLTKPLKSHSFVWQHIHYIVELAEAIRRSSGFKARVVLIFGRPESVDASIRDDVERRFLPRRSPVRTTFGFKAYLTGQLVGSSVLLFVFILLINLYDEPERILTSLILLVTLVNCGALLEQRTWIFYLEYTRLFLIATYLGYEAASPTLFAVMAFIITITVVFLPVRKWYWGLFYNLEVTN